MAQATGKRGVIVPCGGLRDPESTPFDENRLFKLLLCIVYRRKFVQERQQIWTGWARIGLHLPGRVHEQLCYLLTLLGQPRRKGENCTNVLGWGELPSTWLLSAEFVSPIPKPG
jgi:hypothetical protein